MPVLFAFNPQTKFEMSSFIRSKDMVWAPKCRNESYDADHARLRDSQASQDWYFMRRSSIRNLKSLAVAIAEIFQRVYNNNNNDRLTAFDPGQPG